MSSAILIVDDETTWTRNLTRYLQRYGFRAITADCLDTATKALTVEQPALMCLDLRLPDGEGLDLLEKLRAAGNRTPCLLVTGHASDDTGARAKALDAVMIEKPVSLSALRGHIDGALGSGPSGPDGGPKGGLPRVPQDASEAAPRSILMYSHDGYGLGHMRRNLNLAQRLRVALPDTDILMVVGCPTGLFFDLPPGVDFIKLPSIVKVGHGQWRASKLSLDFEATCALRAGLMLQTAQMLRPDLLVVDYLPQGVGGELLPTLDWLRTNVPGARTALGFRDIIDLPERVKAGWAKDGTLDLIDRWYDRVLIYGHSGLFDTATAYGLGERLGDRLVHCGYVAPSPGSAAAPSGAWGFPDRRRLLVTAGGGRDGFALLATTLRALRLLPAADCPETIVVAGPLMDDEARGTLEELAQGLPASILRWAGDGRALAAEADLIVTMAGYNTLTECLSLHKKPIVVPRVGPSQEQRMRTELFGRLGLVQPVFPEELSVNRLADVIGRRLAEPAPAGRSDLVPLDGGERAATELVRLLGEERRHQPPARRAAMGSRRC